MRRRRPRWAAPLAGALAATSVVAAGAGGIALLGGDDDAPRRAGLIERRVDAVAGPLAAPFRLQVPKGWVVREKAEPGWDGRTPMVSLGRGDGSGSVKLRVGGRLEPNLPRLRSILREQIPARVQGARVMSSREVEVSAGNALLTLWVHPTTGRIRSSLVVPAGRRSYVLDGTVEAGADQTALEVAAIFSSFQS